MNRGKFLHTEKIKDHKSGSNDVDLSVYGVFETSKVEWKYYVISHYNRPNSSFFLTTVYADLSLSNSVLECSKYCCNSLTRCSNS